VPGAAEPYAGIRENGRTTQDDLAALCGNFYDYVTLLAAEAPDRYDRAARKWLARLLSESPALTLDEAAVALGCMRGLAAGLEEQSRDVLQALVKRRHETRGQ
jgi:hypothetical protein